MFKNHAVQMKIVKMNQDNGDLVEIPELPKLELPAKEDVIDVAQQVVVTSAVAVVGVIVVSNICRTLSEIAINRWSN